VSDPDILLSKYDEQWPQLFEQEKQFLTQLFLENKLKGLNLGDDNLPVIEHVGSTAITNMLAKPIIDIMVGVNSLEASQSATSVLQQNGYCYTPYKADVMHWFCKPTPEIRTHHLHLIPFESALWLERINFRDALRKNKAIAQDYAELKSQLALQYKGDREQYTHRKWPFIKQVLGR
jgi:GrpB-like predicted nucleotidyltransferase (UPF0157 family)